MFVTSRMLLIETRNIFKHITALHIGAHGAAVQSEAAAIVSVALAVYIEVALLAFMTGKSRPRNIQRRGPTEGGQRYRPVHDNLIFGVQMQIQFRGIPYAILVCRVRKHSGICRQRHRLSQTDRIQDMNTMSILPVQIMTNDNAGLEAPQHLNLKFQNFCFIKALQCHFQTVRIAVVEIANYRIIADTGSPQAVQQFMGTHGIVPMVTGQIHYLHLIPLLARTMTR